MPRIGTASERLQPAHAAHNDTQASRYRADSNFPFYLLVQGEPENLTGPQTSCQELLIRAERYKECTRPPASELAGQSAEIESDRLKEESLLWGWKGREAGEPSSPLQSSRKRFCFCEEEERGPDPSLASLNSTLSPPSLS